MRMKTLFVRLKYLFCISLMLPLCLACNDDNDAPFCISPFSFDFGIKIAVIDKEGNEVLSTIPTTMPMGTYWYDDSSKGLYPKDYTLELYMDDHFVHSMTYPKEQVDWVIVQENGVRTYPWWSFSLSGYHAGELMLDEETADKKHTLEYHMQSELLYGDTKTHVIRFDYKPFDGNALGMGYYADVYFDGEKVETYYPESYKVAAEGKGLKLDIEDKYWLEGAAGWPIAIINLKK